MLNDDPCGLCGRQSIGPAPVILTSASCAASSSGNFHFRLTPCHGTSGSDINSAGACSRTRRDSRAQNRRARVAAALGLGFGYRAHHGRIRSHAIGACARARAHRFGSWQERLSHPLLHNPPECHTWRTLVLFREGCHSTTVCRLAVPERVFVCRLSSRCTNGATRGPLAWPVLVHRATRSCRRLRGAEPETSHNSRDQDRHLKPSRPKLAARAVTVKS